MEQDDIIRFLKGQIKKHGKEFDVVMKYRTLSGKIKKRYGKFVALEEDGELILFNRDKGREGRYVLERIEDIKKDVGRAHPYDDFA